MWLAPLRVSSANVNLPEISDRAAQFRGLMSVEPFGFIDLFAFEYYPLLKKKTSPTEELRFCAASLRFPPRFALRFAVLHGY
jgi:hypothetical protein